MTSSSPATVSTPTASCAPSCTRCAIASRSTSPPSWPRSCPLIVRSVYYDGWVPAHTPQAYHDLRTFLDRVAAEANLAGDTEALFAASAAARVLRAHVSGGEVDDVVSVLPPPVREIFAG